MFMKIILNFDKNGIDKIEVNSCNNTKLTKKPSELNLYFHFLASGRVVSGSVTIVLGGFTMAYDIYKLSSQIETLATKSTESSAEELRQIAQKLEDAVEAIVSTDDKTEVDDFKYK